MDKPTAMVECHALLDAICCCTDNDECSVSGHTLFVLANMAKERVEGILEGL